MNIIVLHSHYLSHALSGENRVVEDELQLLRQAGHEVRDWQPSVSASASSLRVASDVIWSRSATAGVSRLIGESPPDLVHVHSLYPRLSPAVLRAIPPGTPIAMTLHNFRLMCLPATYLRQGSICEECAGRSPARGVLHACYRNSRPASAALAASLMVHRMLKTFSRVDRFFAVSEFVREKHLEVGIDPDRVRVKSNFSWPVPRRDAAGGPLLYLGRITPEKGVDTVLRALPPGLELVVAGDGSDAAGVRDAVGNITFRGPVDPSDVPAVLRGARALLVPSRWYEGQPRVILEAFAAGVPVLASRIGGLTELVDDDVNGHLIDPEDVHGWRVAMENMADDDRSRRLGSGALGTWSQRFTPAIALRTLEDAYSETIAAARAGR